MATVNLPLVGKVPKGWLVAVGGGSALVLGYVYYKHKNSPATATAGGQYPPDGTYGNPSDPYSTDPQTGMTYGDEGLTGSGFGYSGGFGGYPGATTTTKTIIYRGGGPGGTGSGSGPTPGHFSNNAEWAQYAEEQLSGLGISVTHLSAAIGKYLTGRALSADQESLVDQAIAIAGYPPVRGPGGFPPNMKQGGGGGGGHHHHHHHHHGDVKVPDVVGKEVAHADRILADHGLKGHHHDLKHGHGYTVTAEHPHAGSDVAKGSTVHLTIKEHH